MTFVDSNVFMYAVGRPHPLKTAAREFFLAAYANGTLLYTSAEVLQELAHAYLPVGRQETFDAAMELMSGAGIEVWPLEAADVMLARQLHQRHPELQARDLCYLASCQRRGADQIMTFDTNLAAASIEVDGPA